MVMKLLKTLLVLVFLSAVFAGGYVVRAVKQPAVMSTGRRILYYVDPMHPAYKSDKPGVAPDCGMTLEPVYPDESAAPTGTAGPDSLGPSYPGKPAAANPGAIQIPPERQQLIGVKFATVESGGGTRAIRTVGKVSADE